MFLDNIVKVKFLIYSNFHSMSSHLNRLKSRQLNRSQQKPYNSAYQSLSRTSITKTNVVRFGQDQIICSGRKESMQSSQNQKENFHVISKGSFKIRSALKRNFMVKSEVETGFSDKTDEIFQNLVKYNNIRLPATIRKIYGQTAKLTTTLLNSPVLSRSSIMRELKCLMSNSSVHDSYLLSKGLVFRMKQKIKQLNHDTTQFDFKYDEVALLIKKISEHCSDSQQLLKAYEKLLIAHKYPISIELMLLYIGVYLHSINSSYQRAEDICKRFFDQLLKLRLDQYITIYLILMIKLKSNLCEWSKVVSLISKALAAAWVYRLQDLQIWCYFQLSRAHFALGNTQACQFFKQRSQMSITQKQSTIYRQMMEQGYKKQIQHMRIHNYYFNLDTSITYEQLTDHNQRERPSIILKAQVYAKSIAQQFKIKHVKNLISRLGEDSKCYENKKQYAGNPQFLTHESGIKNLNVYFRVKHKRGEQKKLYTYENSSKNYLILKEMMRCLLIQMKWFVPLSDS